MAKKTPKAKAKPAKTLAVSNLGQAALRGAEARAAGTPLKRCPYAPWNPLHDAWSQGWHVEKVNCD